MKFSDIIGQNNIKKHLTQSAGSGRIPHAQLFIGPEGTGVLPMAIAYAQYIICKNSGNENSGGNATCNLKFENFQHPDIHYVFPVATNESVGSKPISDNFMDQWFEFLKTDIYGNINDWYEHLDIKNKQGNISVHEASNILKKLSLKSFEGGYKVMIIWMAEKMNIEASNKLLKLLEEPTDKTVFILIAEDEKAILQTILSRCQVLHFNKLAANDIQEALVKYENCDVSEAATIANTSQGNYNKALKILNHTENDLPFEKWFITWVRAAFRANKNAKVISDLINWSDEISSIGREKQKKFLEYCMEMFRQALLINYKVNKLVYLKPEDTSFKLENFAPFVNDKNILEIFDELSDAMYHIERNGNPKIIFTDLSIKLTRLIHKK